MSNRYVQPGEKVTFVNVTGEEIKSNDIVVFGSKIGVALIDIPVDDNGILAIDKVWELPKETSLEIGAGEKVYWNKLTANLTLDDSFQYAGFAIEKATSDDTICKVKINA